MGDFPISWILFLKQAKQIHICEECETNFTQFIALKSYTYVSIKVVVVGI